MPWVHNFLENTDINATLYYSTTLDTKLETNETISPVHASNYSLWSKYTWFESNSYLKFNKLIYNNIK